jgi:membrane protein DedA with SNARE-associated domain
MAVFVGRFVGPARVVVPLLAGTLGVDSRRFHIANWVSAIAWAPLLLAPTTIAAAMQTWLESMPAEHRSLVSLTIIAGIFFAWRALRRRD